LYAEVDFVIDILPCLVELSAPSEPSVLYDYVIGSGPSVLPLTTYTQTPACNYSPSEYAGELIVANDNLGS